MYLLFRLLVRLSVRMVRRLKVDTRQQDLMSKVRCEARLLKAQAEHHFHE